MSHLVDEYLTHKFNNFDTVILNLQTRILGQVIKNN